MYLYIRTYAKHYDASHCEKHSKVSPIVSEMRLYKTLIICMYVTIILYQHSVAYECKIQNK